MPSLSLDLSLSGWHSAFGGSGAPQKIGGVAIGDAGSGILADLKLVAGDDFETAPTRWSPKNESGKYAHSALTNGFRRTSATDNVFYIDPTYRGARSESPSDLGFDRVSTASSVLTLTASAPEAGLLPYLPTNYGTYGDANGQPKFISGSLKTAPYVMLSAQSDWAIEIYAKTSSGAIAGYWPSFWSTTFFWPDFGEVDVVEGKKTGTQTKNSQNIHLSQTDGAGDVGYNIANTNIPDNRYIRYLARKIGAEIRFYDDVAAAGTLALRATASTNIARIRGAHDIRLDLAVSNEWDGTSYSLTNYPADFKIDWFRVWTPVLGGDNSPAQYLPEINVTAGGSWTATLPSAASVSGGKSGIEQVFGVFDNLDSVGYATRNTTTKLPGGATWNSTTRSIAGTIPTTEGGRVYIGLTYAFDDGTPAKRIFQPYNVAPVVQSLPNKTFAYNTAIEVIIPYTAFHSGNLGHIYTVTSDKPWININGNGTTEITITGTTPNNDDTATISIVVTNSKGQTTTASMFIYASNASLTAFASDLFAGTAGTTILAHTPNIGGAWVAHTLAPNGTSLPCVLNGNGTIYNRYAGGLCLYYPTATPSTPDYSVKGKVNIKTVVADEQIGVCGRLSTSALTFYVARFDTNTNAVRLYKSIAGTLTSLGSYSVTWAAGETHDIELKMLGSTISVLVDGVERISVTDTSITLAGKAGIRMYNTTAATPTTGLHLDEFSAI